MPPSGRIKKYTVVDNNVCLCPLRRSSTFCTTSTREKRTCSVWHDALASCLNDGYFWLFMLTLCFVYCDKIRWANRYLKKGALTNLHIKISLAIRRSTCLHVKTVALYLLRLQKKHVKACENRPWWCLCMSDCVVSLNGRNIRQ